MKKTAMLFTAAIATAAALTVSPNRLERTTRSAKCSGAATASLRRPCTAFRSQVQSNACERIRERMAQPGALGKGTTAYDVSCSFGEPGAVGFDGSRLANGTLGFTFSVPGNALDFRTKTPLGHWADPRFHVTYDLGLVTHLSAVPAVPPLAVDDAVATAANVKVHGGNLSGTLASAFISPAVNESVDLKSAFSEALAAYWPRPGAPAAGPAPSAR